MLLSNLPRLLHLPTLIAEIPEALPPSLWCLSARSPLTRLVGCLLGRLMPFYGPQAGQKRAMAARREEGEEGENRLNRRQKGRERKEGEPSWFGGGCLWGQVLRYHCLEICHYG